MYHSVVAALNRSSPRNPGEAAMRASKILHAHGRPILSSPQAIIALSMRKYIATQKITTQSAHDRLAAQRRNRPTAPHLTIYKWQYVSSASALHRITGMVLSGSLYGLTTIYLLASTVGIHFDSATLVAAFGSLPFAIKTALKFCFAMPFTYHAFNGVKHLVWDTGRLLGKIQSGRASWLVLVCSVSSALLLALGNF